MQELALYLDYRLDESYTPKHISVRAGNSFTDMTEIHTQELEEPHGWTRIPLLTQNIFQGKITRSWFSTVSLTPCCFTCPEYNHGGDFLASKAYIVQETISKHSVYSWLYFLTIKTAVIHTSGKLMCLGRAGIRYEPLGTH